MLFLYLCLLILLSSSKPFVVINSDINVQTSEQIYVVNHGWHSSIVLDARLIKQKIPELSQRFKNKKYIEFGWGDKGFYQANEITIGLTLKAILWPTETVIHTVGFSTHPLKYFKNSDLKQLDINKKQYAQLITFIKNSFLTDKQGSVIIQAKGIYGNSQFYKAEGDYYLMNTCNNWTAKALKSAGLDISPTFKLTSDSIMNSLKES